MQKSTGFTISFWGLLSPTSQNGGKFISFVDNITGDNYICIESSIGNNYVEFTMRSNNHPTNNGVRFYGYADNKWHHYVWGVDNFNNWSIYIDNKQYIGGLSNSNISLTTDVITTGLFALGADYRPNTIAQFISGNIDDFRIYSRVITSTEVNTLYDYIHPSLITSKLALTISSNGNVGIGITNPTNKLEIIGNTSANNISASGSNLTNINWNNLINVPSYYLTSNTLEQQKYINSNSITNITKFYVNSNLLTPLLYADGFINSNNLFVLSSNLGIDTVTQRINAINAIKYSYPLYRTSNIINLLYDNSKFMLNDNNELTLSQNVGNYEPMVAFKFNLSQGHLTYPDLWYFQIKISDFSKSFIIDGNEYHIFNIKSWSDNSLDVINDSLVIITNQLSGIKKIKTNVLQQGETIILNNGLVTTEGWQLDNDINYMTWFSKSSKTIYNILTDQLLFNNNVKITNYNYINSNILQKQDYINSNEIFIYLNNYINSNNLINILNNNYLNYNTQSIDNIKNGIDNQIITSNIINSDLYVNGTLTASNLYIIGSNIILNTDIYLSTSLIIDDISNNNIDTLNITQSGFNSEVASFNNNVLVVSKKGNVGVGIINPNYNLEIIGTLKSDFLIGSGSNIKNIEWSNILDIPNYYITSNIINDVLLYYITSNIFNKIITNDNYIPINNINNINDSLGFNNIINRENSYNNVFNEITYINNTLSNIIINNNLIKNNYGLVIDGTYISCNTINLNNNNSFLYFNCNVNNPYSVNFLSGITYNTSYNNGIATLSSIAITSNSFSYVYDTNYNKIDPIIWYQLTGTYSWLNDSGSSNLNLINYGNVGYNTFSYPIPNRGGSVNFIPSNYLAPNMQNTDLAVIQQTSGLTFSFWCYSITNTSGYLFYYGNNDYTNCITIFFNGQRLCLAIKATGVLLGSDWGYGLDGGYHYWSDSIWHHYVWTFDASGFGTFYIDGIYKGNYSGNIISTTQSKRILQIGKNITGNMADFRIYNTHLSQEQVLQIYNPSFNLINITSSNIYTIQDNTYPVLKYNPNSWYKFDNDGILNDASYNNNILSSINNPLYTNIQVKGNNSVSLNGSNQFLFNSNLNYNLTSNSFSVCSWIYPKINSNMCLVSFGSNNINFGINNSNYYFNFNDIGIYSASNILNNINTWNHITFTYNNSTNILLIYRNGIIIGTNYNNISIPSNVLQNIIIGKYNNSNYWNGYIDDLRVYNNVVLNSTEILELYTGKINYLHYNTDGPLYINNISKTVGVNTTSAQTSLAINGSLFGNNLIGSGSNVSNIAWNNLNNIDLKIQNTSNNITSNTFIAQQFLNSNNTAITYISSNIFYNQYCLNSNNVISIITNYSNAVLGTYHYVNSNVLTNLLYNDTTNLINLQNNYGTILDKQLVGNNTFTPAYNIEYLHFNNDTSNIITLDKPYPYNIAYNNGTSILSYIADNTSNSSNIPSSSLKIWYKFLSTNLLADSSGNNNTLINGGTATYNTTNYVYNNCSLAISTDTNSYLQLQNYNYGSSNALSVSMWVYISQYNNPSDISFYRIFNAGVDNRNEVSSIILQIQTNTGNKLTFIVTENNGNQNGIYTSFSFPLNTWVHIAFTIIKTIPYYIGAGLLTIYINNTIATAYIGGAEIRDYVFLYPINSNVITNLGKDIYVSSLNSQYRQYLKFDGYINDFRVYDTCLTSTQISMIYNNYTNVLTSNVIIASNNTYPILNNITPLSWYSFDNTYKDLISNSNLLIVYNNPTFTSGIKNYNSLYLNGINQYLTGYNDLSYNSFSISFWFNKQYNSNMSFINFNNILNLNTSNNTYNFNFSNTYLSTSNYSSDINNWTHLAFLYDKSTYSKIIYRNGNIINSNVMSPNTHTNIKSFVIGSNLNGSLFDLRIYNKLLTSNQVNELYTGKITSYYYLNNNKSSLHINNYANTVGINTINPQIPLSIIGDTYSTTFSGIGSNIIDIDWNNIELPTYLSNTNLLLSSNVLQQQNYINSNSIQDLLKVYIYSNVLQEQNYINSNSITDIVNFLISSNNLQNQNYINSNSINDIINFLISSNNLQDQNYINSNSIENLLKFLTSSNILQKQNYINYNSIQDLVEFFISSNTLQNQNYINSNSIENLLKFLTSSNVLQDQNYINSNSIKDIVEFYISSNNLQDQNYINSNSIQNLVEFLLSSNILSKQNYINSNSIQDLVEFYISSNILSKQNYINSNSINDILTNYVYDLNIQDYVNSNTIQDLLGFYISSNELNYINSNSVENLLGFYISSNNLQDQNYINSNTINDLLGFYISSNELNYISSNILSNQNYINSNSIQDITTFYISSNDLTNVLLFYATSNITVYDDIQNLLYSINNANSNLLRIYDILTRNNLQ